jgi:hypothetical protein
MKPIPFIAAITLLAATITACKSNGSSTTKDTTKDTVAKATKDGNVFKAPLDTIKTDTVERNPSDTLDARPVH